MEKQKFDHRNLAAILFTGMGVGVTWIGDQATFVHPPRNVVENISTLTHVVGFKITAQRIYADALAFLFYLTIFLLVLVTVRRLLAKHVIWPAKIKKMMKELALHRDLANQFNRTKLGDSIL
jgi:hypothetical protein